MKKEVFALDSYHGAPGAGLEPARSFLRGILSPLCLPIPPPGHDFNYSLRFISQFKFL